MRKGTIKAAVLAAVFIGAVLIFGRFMNDTNEDLTTEMKEATLPVITMYQGDQELNELHGDVTEMDAAYMRDTITPVGEDRKLPIVIQTNQTAVDTISYEIRSLELRRRDWLPVPRRRAAIHIRMISASRAFLWSRRAVRCQANAALFSAAAPRTDGRTRVSPLR